MIKEKIPTLYSNVKPSCYKTEEVRGIEKIDYELQDRTNKIHYCNEEKCDIKKHCGFYKRRHEIIQVKHASEGRKI